MERATNPIDFLRAFGCFCIIWFHTPFYWSLTGDIQNTADLYKLIGISWAMPFFYTTAFYFLLSSGLKKIPTSLMLRKVRKIFIIQIAIVVIYEGHGILQLFLQEKNLSAIADTLINKWHFDELPRIFLSGNSSPAYFLGELFLLYMPIYFLGRVIRLNTLYGFLAVIVLLLCYLSGIEGIFITREAYFYLSLAIAFTLLGRNSRSTTMRKKLPLVASLAIVISFIRISSNENLFIIIVLIFAYYLFSKNKNTSLINDNVSRIGQNYSLFIFSSHSLMFSGVELVIYRLDFIQPIIISHELLIFALINSIVFFVSAVLAVFLHKRFKWILRI